MKNDTLYIIATNDYSRCSYYDEDEPTIVIIASTFDKQVADKIMEEQGHEWQLIESKLT